MQTVSYPVPSFPVLGPECDLTRRLLPGLLIEDRARREWRRIQMQGDRGVYRTWILDAMQPQRILNGDIEIFKNTYIQNHISRITWIILFVKIPARGKFRLQSDQIRHPCSKTSHICTIRSKVSRKFIYRVDYVKLSYIILIKTA